jgi:hypothetical protein
MTAVFDLESTRIIERDRRARQAEQAALMRAIGRVERSRIRGRAAATLRALAERLDPGAQERLEEVRP